MRMAVRRGPASARGLPSTTPAGRIRRWAGRRPWRCGALARAAFSTRGLWTGRFAWTTRPRLAHRPPAATAAGLRGLIFGRGRRRFRVQLQNRSPWSHPRGPLHWISSSFRRGIRDRTGTGSPDLPTPAEEQAVVSPDLRDVGSRREGLRHDRRLFLGRPGPPLAPGDPLEMPIARAIVPDGVV